MILLIRFSLYIKLGLFTTVLNFEIKKTRRQMDNLILTVSVDHRESTGLLSGQY